jgi:hypothetical protein
VPPEVWDDPCNDLVCDPVDGWHPTPVEGPCDDGNACTHNDHCVDGACAGDPDQGCECTADSDCPDDDNLCNGGIVCLDFQCQGDGASVVCGDDGNPCTLSTCQPETGACEDLPLPNGTGCNDGDFCTTGDACHQGVCEGGLPPSCHDGNPCTADQCDSLAGCIFPLLSGVACDDGDVCTIHDKCVAGACSGSPITCDDDNSCTQDLCAAGGCLFTPLSGGACEDGDPCTAGDSCVAGTCVGGGDICPSCGNGVCAAGEDCLTCPQDCGWCVGPGECCAAHTGPACDDLQVLLCVCPSQPSCCLSSWTQACVNLAKNPCGLSCGSTCGDGACDEGEDCASCAQDCGGCQSNCCNAKSGPGCDDDPCEDAVCDIDPFCCNGQWDGQCAVQAGQHCDVCGGGVECGDGICDFGEDCQSCSADCGGCTNNCCHQHENAGCEGPTCQGKVCQQDPWCCQEGWDAYCVSWAQDLCSICG